MILLFDGSFNGFLTAVFVAYEHKFCAPSLVAEHDYVPSFLTESHTVITDDAKATRVWQKLQLIFGETRPLLWAFLSEDSAVYSALFAIIRAQLQQPSVAILDNYTDPNVRLVQDCVKKVGRERHRVKAFVRFVATSDGVYFAKIEPDFNVLPIVADFFAKRFADMPFLIADLVRGYGIYFDLKTVHLITDIDKAALRDSRHLYTTEEVHYQHLWQAYFQHATITARKNRKLHLQQMPRRYWKHLTEKQGR